MVDGNGSTADPHWNLATSPSDAGEGPARLTIDHQLNRVAIDGRLIALRPKEYQLVSYLALHEGVFVPRSQILTDVWDDPGCLYLNSLHVHVSRVRMKLGESSHYPRFVHTSRLGGVMLLSEWPPRWLPSPDGRSFGADHLHDPSRSLSATDVSSVEPPRLDGIARLGLQRLSQVRRGTER